MSAHATYSAYPRRVVIPRETFLAYAPQGAGVMCALVYFVAGDDVFGWWVGARGYEYPSAYFCLDGYYAGSGAHFYVTRGGDLYGGWVADHAGGEAHLPDPLPVADEVCHQLAQVQSEFVSGFLFYGDGEEARAETALYEAAELPVKPVNIRHAQLMRFRRNHVLWTHASHDVDWNLVDFMRRRWPLDLRTV